MASQHRFSLPTPAKVILSLGVLVLIFFPFRAYLFHTGGRWLYIFLFSCTVSFFLTPVVRWVGLRLGIVDLPSPRKIHMEPTPRLGGLAIYIAFVSAVLTNLVLNRQVVAILIGGTFLLLWGIVDDAKGLPASGKLALQILAVALIIYAGVDLEVFPKRGVGLVGNALLTIIWVVGITNAMNFFDGMDGLAPGLSIITALAIGLVAFQTYQPFLGWLSAAIAGGCLGFLPYNFRPRQRATIFLGDGGSTFLGFTLSSLAVLGEWSDQGPIVSLTPPVLIFWVFIFDMTHITLTRVLTGKVRSFGEWIAYVGKDHLHHRFSALLGSERGSVFMIFLLAACTDVAALVLRRAETRDAVILLAQAVMIVTVVAVLEIYGNRPRQ